MKPIEIFTALCDGETIKQIRISPQDKPVYYKMVLSKRREGEYHNNSYDLLRYSEGKWVHVSGLFERFISGRYEHSVESPIEITK